MTPEAEKFNNWMKDMIGIVAALGAYATCKLQVKLSS